MTYSLFRIFKLTMTHCQPYTLWLIYLPWLTWSKAFTNMYFRTTTHLIWIIFKLARQYGRIPIWTCVGFMLLKIGFKKSHEKQKSYNSTCCGNSAWVVGGLSPDKTTMRLATETIPPPPPNSLPSLSPRCVRGGGGGWRRLILYTFESAMPPLPAYTIFPSTNPAISPGNFFRETLHTVVSKIIFLN